MKLHTVLTEAQVSNALFRVHVADLVARDVYFTEFTAEPSKSRPNGFRIQLGTDDPDLLGGKRNYKNSGGYGASNVYAATWYEWGWFIARIFDMDPTAIFGTEYKTREAFNAATDNIFTDLRYAVVDTKRNELRRNIKPGQSPRVIARFATYWEAFEFINEAPGYYADGYEVRDMPTEDMPCYCGTEIYAHEPNCTGLPLDRKGAPVSL